MYIVNSKRLKELRTQKRISQEKIANNLYIDQSYYNKIENGKAHPSADLLFRLAEELVVDAKELIMDANGILLKFKANNKSIEINHPIHDFEKITDSRIIEKIQNRMKQSLQIIYEYLNEDNLNE